MVSIPRSICSLRGCKIPFPNLFDFVLFRPQLSEFFEEEEPKLLFSLLSAATTSVAVALSSSRSSTVVVVFTLETGLGGVRKVFIILLREKKKTLRFVCRCKIQFFYFFLISKRDVFIRGYKILSSNAFFVFLQTKERKTKTKTTLYEYVFALCVESEPPLQQNGNEQQSQRYERRKRQKGKEEEEGEEGEE